MAPELIIAEIVGIAVFAAVIISSPCFIFNAFNEIKSASVPLPTAIPYFDLYFFTKLFSKFSSSFPKKIFPLFSDFLIFFIKLSLYLSYSLFYDQNLII